MDDAMRIEVIPRDDEAELTEASSLFVDAQVDQFGERVRHEFRSVTFEMSGDRRQAKTAEGRPVD
jgi:hypothetical protein